MKLRRQRKTCEEKANILMEMKNEISSVDGGLFKEENGGGTGDQMFCRTKHMMISR